jgi:uncharacterized membrane protein
MPADPTNPSSPRSPRAFRRTVLRGVGIVLPPLLTVVIFLWAGNTIRQYVLDPLIELTRDGLARGLADVRRDLSGPTAIADGTLYTRLPDGAYIPALVYDTVVADAPDRPPPVTAKETYQRFVEVQYLRSYLVIPIFLVGFILAMYLLGKFLALGAGRFFVQILEGIIRRLPLVRTVYSSVKQVTEFMFSESELQFKRVVAVEFPRKGLWSVGLVTNESFRAISEAAGEPVVAVMVPYSPWSLSGYTVVVPKRETIDLNMTLDQAIQFIVSCGVVVPAHQLPRTARPQIAEDAETARVGRYGP